MSAAVKARSPASTRSAIAGRSSSFSAPRVQSAGAPVRRETSAAVSAGSSIMICRTARANMIGSGFLWWKFSANWSVSASRRLIPTRRSNAHVRGSPSASSTSRIAATRRKPATSS